MTGRLLVLAAVSALALPGAASADYYIDRSVADHATRVRAHGEILKDMHEALLAVRDELVRLRRGDPPAGTVARY
jgi:hypothetical protein